MLGCTGSQQEETFPCGDSPDLSPVVFPLCSVPGCWCHLCQDSLHHSCPPGLHENRPSLKPPGLPKGHFSFPEFLLNHLTVLVPLSSPGIFTVLPSLCSFSVSFADISAFSHPVNGSLSPLPPSLSLSTSPPTFFPLRFLFQGKKLGPQAPRDQPDMLSPSLPTASIHRTSYCVH